MQFITTLQTTPRQSDSNMPHHHFVMGGTNTCTHTTHSHTASLALFTKWGQLQEKRKEKKLTPSSPPFYFYGFFCFCFFGGRGGALFSLSLQKGKSLAHPNWSQGMKQSTDSITANQQTDQGWFQPSLGCHLNSNFKQSRKAHITDHHIART